MGKCNILKVLNDNNQKLKKLLFLSSGGGGAVGEGTYIKYLVLNQVFPEDSDKNHKVFTVYPYRTVTRGQHPSAKR